MTKGGNTGGRGGCKSWWRPEKKGNFKCPAWARPKKDHGGNQINFGVKRGDLGTEGKPEEKNIMSNGEGEEPTKGVLRPKRGGRKKGKGSP